MLAFSSIDIDILMIWVVIKYEKKSSLLELVSFKAGLKMFCGEVVQHLFALAPSPCLQTSRSLNEENVTSADIQHLHL